MKSVRTQDGTSLSYRCEGEGPPVLLAHGLLGDSSFWTEIASGLKGRYRLIIPDQRGHGKSRATRPFTLWDMADDLVALLDAEEVEQATLVGFSMGGMASMRCALRYPDRVKALSLVATAASTESPLMTRYRLLMASIVQRVGPLRLLEPMVKDLMFTREFRKAEPQLVHQTMEVLRGQEGVSLAHAIRAVFGRDDISHKIHAISQPAQILVGSRDKLTPIVFSKRIAQALSKSELSVIPGLAHMCPTEGPERVLPLMDEYLSRVAGEEGAA